MSKIRDYYSNAKWCIDNDFQVYVKPDYPHFRIAVRRGGISTHGKDFRVDECGFEHTSTEQLGTVKYKTADLAGDKIREVHEYLKNKYEKRDK